MCGCSERNRVLACCLLVFRAVDFLPGPPHPGHIHALHPEEGRHQPPGADLALPPLADGVSLHRGEGQSVRHHDQTRFAQLLGRGQCSGWMIGAVDTTWCCFFSLARFSRSLWSWRLSSRICDMSFFSAMLRLTSVSPTTPCDRHSSGTRTETLVRRHLWFDEGHVRGALFVRWNLEIFMWRTRFGLAGRWLRRAATTRHLPPTRGTSATQHCCLPGSQNIIRDTVTSAGCRSLLRHSGSRVIAVQCCDVPAQ